jgi:hypothetical protein
MENELDVDVETNLDLNSRVNLIKVILLLLVVSKLIFASDTEEIGIPAVDFKKARIESAVLTDDGKSFYTLQDEDLVLWNLSPLRKVKSWKVSTKPVLNQPPSQKYHHLHFVENYKKVLISSADELMLFNLENNTVEKRKYCRNHTVVQDRNTLYVARVAQKGDFDEKGKLVARPDLFLEIWDIPTLEKIQLINVTRQSDKFPIHLLRYRDEGELLGEFHFASRYQGQLLIGDKVLYYIAVTKKIAVIDKRSLLLKNVFWKPELPVELTADDLMVIGIKVYNKSNGSVVKEFSKNDFESMTNFLSETKKLPIYNLPMRTRRIFSSVGDLILSPGGGSYVFHHKGEKKFFARIGFYDGELIVQERSKLFHVHGKVKVSPGYFEVSSKKFELLNMKNNKGEIVPINDITFKKYNKSLGIKVRKGVRYQISNK